MDITDEQYMTLCNLVEAIWLKRNDSDYYNIDLANLPPLTSGEARRIATFIAHTLADRGTTCIDCDREISDEDVAFCVCTDCVTEIDEN